MDLALEIYDITKDFPSDEKYGLTSQIRRAATSIPFNIAEGCGRDTKKDLVHFLHISEGSASELQCEIEFVYRLNFLSESSYNYLNSKIVVIRRKLRLYKEQIEKDL